MYSFIGNVTLKSGLRISAEPPKTVLLNSWCSLTSPALGTQCVDVEALVERLAETVPVLSSTLCLRQDFREEVHRHPSLSYIDKLSWPGLGAVR